MSFEYFVAMKYLFKGKRQGFVSLISFISVLGVAVGVMALIVVLAVMSGFDKELKQKIVGVQPHVVIESFYGIEDPEKIREMVLSMQIPEIVSIAPFVQGQAIVRSRYNAMGAVIKAVDPEYEPLDLFQQHLKLGSMSFEDVQVQTEGDREKSIGRILIGEELARRLGVALGDVVYVISPAFDADLKSDLKRAIKRAQNEPFAVSGIFRLGMNDFDTNLALLHLHQGQRLYRMGKRITGMSIRLSNVDRANEIKRELQGRFGTSFRIRSWMDVNQSFFQALKVEKSVMTILLSLIILVAAFNIVSTLIMTVMEKTRDIGILRALGARSYSVRQIFLLQGFFVGFVGVVFGAAAGLALAYNLNPVADFLERYFNISVFPSDIYYFDRIPAEVNMPDVVVVIVFAVLMSLMAGVYPAHRASKLTPVQALRYE